MKTITSTGPALALFTGACLALAPTVKAVTPAPDGGYDSNNTAEGTHALFSLTTGTDNTAIGFDALYSNIQGSFNTAIGSRALLSNTTGGDNTAAGVGALISNTSGTQNTATGLDALWRNTTGSANTANGVFALHQNTIGTYNTAIGYGAMYRNRNGNLNTATGHEALIRNTIGSSNTANGDEALSFSTTGSNNIALGASAGFHLTIGSNNIDIGSPGVADESNTIRIGRKRVQTATFIAGVHGTTTVNMNAVPVVIDSEGQLGTVSSSARFKDEIKPMDKASETILGLKPVTFHYKSDNTGTAQFGLIAEEVAKANPDLVVRDEKGEIYTVRYDAVNAMLLNEFLKEHHKVEEQDHKVEDQGRKEQEDQATISQLKSAVAKQEAALAQQQKQIETLTTGLRKVSDQLEVSTAAPQLVAHNQ